MARERTKMRRCAYWSIMIFFLLSFLVGNVMATTDVYDLEPSTEVIWSLRLTASESISGNLSVVGGVMDFYVTNPSGAVVFCYNETSTTDFTFTASEDGNYTFHFVNSHSPETVTVTMNYWVNRVYMLQENINVSWHLAQTVETSLLTSPPLNPLLEFLKQIWEALLVGLGYLLPLMLEKILGKIWDFLKKIPWWWKHRKRPKEIYDIITFVKRVVQTSWLSPKE